MTIEPRYAAFISYRHLPEDARWAKWLIQALERYRTPAELQKRGHRPRLGRLFRDQDELPTSSNLNDQIREALANSANLIVICSPQTPQSQWVRREIQTFKELGRGARIFPLLIAGEPAQSFPTELLTREVVQPDGTTIVEPVEPLAADVRGHALSILPSRARRDALLRLAAGILGVAYDDLAQRERARTHRRTMMVAGVAAGIAFSALVGGWFYWDSTFAVKSVLCANFVERWGLPECVTPLSSDIASQRERSWKINSRGGHVFELLQIDGHGRLVAGGPIRPYDHYFLLAESSTNEDRDESKEVASIAYSIDAAGRPAIALMRDAGGNEIKRLIYEFSPDGHQAYVDLRQGFGGLAYTTLQLEGETPFSFDAPQVAYSRIARHLLSYSDVGEVTERRFLSLNGTAAADDSGNFGEAYEHDGGRIVAIRGLDANGVPHSDVSGVATTAFTYDARGELSTATWRNSQGERAQSILYENDTAFERSAVGNVDAIVDVRYAGVDVGTIVFTARELSVDGDLLSLEYLDGLRRPFIPVDTYYSRIAYTRDEQGRLLREDYFDPDGKATYAGWSGDTYTSIVYAYPEPGRTLVSYVGGNGQPEMTDMGYAVIETIEADRQVTQLYRDPSGALINGMIERFDDLRRLTSRTFLGADGNPTPVNGVTTIEWSYDGRGNLAREANLDAEGHSVGDQSGIAERLAVYDEDGNVVRQEFHATDGSLINSHYASAAIIESVFGADLQLSQRVLTGAGGQLPGLDAGIARQVTDMDGNNETTTTFGADGSRIADADGVWKIVSANGPAPGRSVTAYFGTDDEPVIGPRGYASQVVLDDIDTGNQRIENFGTDGKFVANSQGIAIVESRTDEASGTETLAFFGPDERPVANKSGVAEYRTTYGEEYDFTVMFLDPSGSPTMVEGSYGLEFGATALSGYRAMRFLGADGQPAPNSDGIAEIRVEETYNGDAFERETIDFIGAQDKPVAGWGNVARIETVVVGDSSEEIRFLSIDGAIIDNPMGAARISIVWSGTSDGQYEAYTAAGTLLSGNGEGFMLPKWDLKYDVMGALQFAEDE